MRRFKIPLGVTIFAVIWGLVLLVPPLRESFAVWRTVQNQFFPHRAEAGEWQARYPNDPRFAAAALRDDFLGSESEARKRVLLQFDALSRRFPLENWIRADRLRASTTRAIGMETEMSTVPPPDGASRSTARWLNNDDLRLALAQAVEGRKREPDNAFFSWMEAVFHFALRENDAALAALKRAGKCPRWNDYTGDEVRRRFAIYSLEKDLLWEEKVALSAAQLYLHFNSMSGAKEAAIWQGVLAMRRGDHQRALQIFEAVMSASGPLQASGDSFIGVLAGERQALDVWERVARENGTSFPLLPPESSHSATPQYRLQLAQAFALYARKHGRGDLAAQAVSDAEQGHTAQMSELWSNFAATSGLSAPQARVAFQGAWLGATLGFCALCCAAFWTLTSFMPSPNSDSPSMRAQTARCASFTFWAGAIFFGLLLRQGAGGEFLELWSELNESELAARYEYARVLQVGLPWVLLCLWLLPVAWTTYRRPQVPSTLKPSPQEKKFPLRAARAALWGMAGIAVLVLCLDNSDYQGAFDETILQRPNAGIALTLFLLACIGFEIALARRGGDWRGVLVALAAAIGSGGAARSFGFPRFDWAMVAVSVLGFFTALTLWAREQNGRETRSPAWENALFFGRLARGSAGALSVVCSVLYLFAALSIWPPRAKLNAVFEHRLQIGEVAAMREQIALQRQTAPK